MTLAGRLLPPLALMGLIFFLSAQPDLGTGLGVWDTILRKAAHMTEYGVLWWLWHRALRFRHPAAAVAIAVTYAATDEFHQHFVSGRHGTPVDVAIDAVGVAIAIAASRYGSRASAAAAAEAGGSGGSGTSPDTATSLEG